MTTSDADRPVAPSTRSLHDRRTVPPGVLPRHLQTWLMAGLAAVIVVIILVTGHSAPVPRASAPPSVPVAATAERIRGYQRQLEEEQRRQLQLEQQQAARDARENATASNTTSAATTDADAEHQHRQ